ncbi:hypothetical protein [Borreliella americana]|uniref:hypothetical protein n=1 Tax=Borreliella americana TaxID=478807 RepID=UPI001E28929D|nr:hypothetical protein [Borreliella americana]MCD2349928.1 hypothetical protein [Borreliella americana]MCD2382764.1 hypothetical protein [Borreliella americana]
MKIELLPFEGKSRSLCRIKNINGNAAFAIGIAFNEYKMPIEYTLLIHDYFIKKQSTLPKN